MNFLNNCFTYHLRKTYFIFNFKLKYKLYEFEEYHEQNLEDKFAVNNSTNIIINSFKKKFLKL